MKFDQDLCLKCDMISRCYFGKKNSILGSVVPLAMFNYIILVGVLLVIFCESVIICYCSLLLNCW